MFSMVVIFLSTSIGSLGVRVRVMMVVKVCPLNQGVNRARFNDRISFCFTSSSHASLTLTVCLVNVVTYIATVGLFWNQSGIQPGLSFFAARTFASDAMHRSLDSALRHILGNDGGASRPTPLHSTT